MYLQFPFADLLIIREFEAKYAEMVLHQMWCVANLRIRSVEVQGDSAAIRFHQPESRIQFEHPWPRPMVTTDGHNSAFYLTNARELQDVPGEWYHDIDARKIYYYPRGRREDAGGGSDRACC